LADNPTAERPAQRLQNVGAWKTPVAEIRRKLNTRFQRSYADSFNAIP